MKNVQSYRALGSLCRQRAVFDPENSWKHLSEAERWEHLAAIEISVSKNATPDRMDKVGSRFDTTAAA